MLLLWLLLLLNGLLERLSRGRIGVQEGELDGLLQFEVFGLLFCGAAWNTSTTGGSLVLAQAGGIELVQAIDLIDGLVAEVRVLQAEVAEGVLHDRQALVVLEGLGQLVDLLNHGVLHGDVDEGVVDYRKEAVVDELGGGDVCLHHGAAVLRQEVQHRERSEKRVCVRRLELDLEEPQRLGDVRGRVPVDQLDKVKEQRVIVVLEVRRRYLVDERFNGHPAGSAGVSVSDGSVCCVSRRCRRPADTARGVPCMLQMGVVSSHRSASPSAASRHEATGPASPSVT